MADYKELLRRAIAALPENTGASRRVIYEQARAALISQLRKMTPPPPAGDITTHRLQLEDCIRQVEQEVSEANTADIEDRVPLAAPRPLRSVPDLVVAKQMAISAKDTAGKSAKEQPPDSVAPDQRQRQQNRPPSVSKVSGFFVNPTVFKLPTVVREVDYLSVMMPFDDALLPVYRAIRRAGEDAGFRVGRGDDLWEDQVIIEDIFSMIFRSSIVICDFTGRNPNVFYEAGIAHTLGRHVVPIVQDKNDIPFDIRHHRFLPYRNTKAGLPTLRKKLAERLKFLASAGAEVTP